MAQYEFPYTPKTTPADKAAGEAISARQEVLTPKGAMRLFGLSEAAVRRARLKDKTGVRFVLTVTEKPVSMLSLDWALKLWGPLDNKGKNELRRMRQSRHTLSLDGNCYLMLHPKSIAKEGPEADMHSAGSRHLENRAAS